MIKISKFFLLGSIVIGLLSLSTTTLALSLTPSSSTYWVEELPTMSCAAGHLYGWFRADNQNNFTQNGSSAYASCSYTTIPNNATGNVGIWDPPGASGPEGNGLTGVGEYIFFEMLSWHCQTGGAGEDLRHDHLSYTYIRTHCNQYVSGSEKTFSISNNQNLFSSGSVAGATTVRTGQMTHGISSSYFSKIGSILPYILALVVGVYLVFWLIKFTLRWIKNKSNV